MSSIINNRGIASLGFGLLFLLTIACKKKCEETVIPTPPPIANPLDSSGFPTPTYDFASNPLDEKKFRLGRMLFYDPILSRDSCVSCSACHQQTKAFASPPGHTFSHGVDGKTGTRNANGLFNLAWSPNFMWDGAILNLEMQALAPLQDSVEMDEKLPNVLRKLNKHPLYRPRFKEAFGGDSITSQQMLKALAQFTVQLVSNHSKYDFYKQGKETLAQGELEGLALTQKYCTSCHAGELFTDFGLRNIGLDSTALYTTDLGRELVTHVAKDRRKFKTPTLRNLTLSAPYFHDGRATDLRRAIEFHGEQDAPNLDPKVIVNGQRGFRLSGEELDKIYQFLLTLTDQNLITNSRFSLLASDFAPYSIERPVRCPHFH